MCLACCVAGFSHDAVHAHDSCLSFPAAILNIISDRQRELEGQRGGYGGGMGGGMGGPVPGRETLDLPVPNMSVGLVIGRGGATIKMIQDRTGTHIQIPKGPDADDATKRTINISGPSLRSVEDAKAEILAIVNQDNSSRDRSSGPGPSGGAYGAPPGAAVTIQVPNDKVGLIIGRAGATIHDIQNRTSTHIQIPTEPDAGSSPPVRTVSITGNPQGCEAARAEIYQLVNVS